MRSHVESGKLIALATTGIEPWTSFPNVPAFDEQGLKGVNYDAWPGLLGPPGLPDPIAERLKRAFVDAFGSRDVRARLDAAGLVARGGPPEEWATHIRSELALWRPIGQGANIKPDP